MRARICRWCAFGRAPTRSRFDHPRSRCSLEIARGTTPCSSGCNLIPEPMDQSNRRAFAARYTEPSGRRWVAEEVARLETVVASVDGPAPRMVLRFTSEDSLSEQRFTRCGPLRWTSPEILEALFLSARPIRTI